MTIEREVHRLSGELADWLGIDAGHLVEGKPADIVAIDPDGLTDQVDKAVDAPMEGLPGFNRVVGRNDAALPVVHQRKTRIGDRRPAERIAVRLWLLTVLERAT